MVKVGNEAEMGEQVETGKYKSAVEEIKAELNPTSALGAKKRLD